MALSQIRMDSSAQANRQFFVQLLLVLVVAAMGGANLYVQASRGGESVTVGTGDAAAAQTKGAPPEVKDAPASE